MTAFPDNRTQLLSYRLFGHLFFLGLAIFALVFYQERTGLMDTAYYLFRMVETEWFIVPHDRFGAALTQILPVALIRLKAPLPLVMQAYSLNFILVYWLCYGFVLRVSKKSGVALAIVLLMVYGIQHLFFWPVSEMFQGSVYALVTLSWMLGRREAARSPMWHGVVLFLLMSLTILTHSVLALPMLLVVVWDRLEEERWQAKGPWIWMGIGIVVIFALRALKGENEYEKNRTDAIYNIAEMLPGLQENTFLKQMKLLLRHHYRGLVVGAAGLSLWLLVAKKWLKLVVFWGFCLAYTLIAALAYPQGDSFLILENLLLPLIFAQVLVFGTEVFPFLKTLKLELPILLIFILIGAGRIASVSHNYEGAVMARQDLIHNLRQWEGEKFIMDMANVDREFIPFSWPLFAETMHISARENPDDALVVYVAKPDELPELFEKEGQENFIPMLPWWKFHKQNMLSEDYYRFGQTRYVHLSPQNPVPDSLTVDFAEKLSIEWENPLRSVKRGHSENARLLIENRSGIDLPSSQTMDEKWGLTNYWYAGEEPLKWSGNISPLSMDVKATHLQSRKVGSPGWSGDFELEWALIRTFPDTTIIRSPRYPIRIR